MVDTLDAIRTNTVLSYQRTAIQMHTFLWHEKTENAVGTQVAYLYGSESRERKGPSRTSNESKEEEETLNPRPQTPDPRPQTSNPNPDPRPQTSDPKPHSPHPKPKTPSSKSYRGTSLIRNRPAPRITIGP